MTHLNFSFEIFPSKTPEDFLKLKKTISVLKTFNPQFISLTCGAMGAKRVDSIPILEYIQNTMNIKAVAHYTCLHTSVAETHHFMKQLKKIGVSSIVALRGDMGKKEDHFVARDFVFASDLVSFMTEHYPDFSLFVAGYPDGHPESPNLETDLNHLALKIEQGANAIITQLFFDNKTFFDFYKKVQNKGISCPVIPGIMPIYSKKNVEKIVQMCGVSIPQEIEDFFQSKNGSQTQSIESFLVDFTLKQCLDLKKRGINHFHFYTLNQYKMIEQICSKLREVFL